MVIIPKVINGAFSRLDNKDASNVVFGEIIFSNKAMYVHLKPCISLVVISEESEIAGISHIVGHSNLSNKLYYSPDLAVKGILNYKNNAKLMNEKYFLIGGQSKGMLKLYSRNLLKETNFLLNKKQLESKMISTLGNFNRTVFIDMSKNKFLIYES